MSNLTKKVQNTIFEHNLFSRGSKMLIACSGGPDSTALLNVFSKLKKKYDLEIAVVHVNYRLRKKNSEEDEKFVRKLALKYNLSLKVLKPKLPKKISEDVLRDIRYKFFEKTRKNLLFDFIAIGHTLDDQVETFLMRLIRGSGLAGLSSIAFKNKKIIRPLLNISKNEILGHLEKNRLAYRIDKTNLESKFTRNKIRNKLIPYLEKNFNPNISKTIFDATQSISEDYNFIEDVSQKAYSNFNILSVKKIIRLHPALQRRILLAAIKNKRASLRDIESSNISELLKIIKSTKNKVQIVLFRGLKVIRKGDNITIENN
jgi:tRNA(Ile)-lysidine synthase